MKQKTTIILIVLGFIILTSLCLCENPSTEGLNTMKKGTHVLHRGEYMDDVGRLKSEDGSYGLILRNGSLQCWEKKKNGRWRRNWRMNASGSKLMLLNKHGTLQFKSSKNAEYIPITESHGANSLVLTAYGTLELKSETDGNGETLWAYPVTEGLVNAEITTLFHEMGENRKILEHEALYKANLELIALDTATGAVFGNTVNHAATRGTWDDFYNDNSGNYIPGTTVTTSVIDSIPTESGTHSDLLDKNRKMLRLRNELDNKVKVLNSLGDSHVTEKEINLDSTIFVSLAWTAIASSLVYYTFTH